MSSVGVNDILDELKVENIRLSNELLIAQKFIKSFTKMKAFIDIHSNQLKTVLNSNEWLMFAELDKELNQIVFKLNANHSLQTNTTEDLPMTSEDTNKSSAVCRECGKRLQSDKEFQSEPQINQYLKTVFKAEPDEDWQPEEDNAESESEDDEWPISGHDLEMSDEEQDKAPNDAPEDEENKCNICYKRFPNTDTLRQHLNRDHGLDGGFKCSFEGCGKSCSTKTRLKQHEEKHQMGGEFTCAHEGCGKRFLSEKRLRIHQRYIHQVKNYRCEWPGCDYVSSRKDKISRHISSHSDERNFVCQHEGCGKAFKRKDRLDFHVKKHSNDFKFSCSWPGCEFRCQQRYIMTQHMTTHTAERLHACDWPECGKRFKTRGQLSTHSKIHTSEQVRCDWPGCPYVGKTDREARQHMKNVHCVERNHVCDWPDCGKRFKNRGNLRGHMILHTGSFACHWPGCQYRGARPDYLTLHMKTHNKL